LPHLVDVGAHRIANGGHRIDETDLHRQESVRGILDQFGRLRAGD
jgi:hypothetical protein